MWSKNRLVQSGKPTECRVMSDLWVSQRWEKGKGESSSCARVSNSFVTHRHSPRGPRYGNSRPPFVCPSRFHAMDPSTDREWLNRISCCSRPISRGSSISRSTRSARPATYESLCEELAIRHGEFLTYTVARSSNWSASEFESWP